MPASKTAMKVTVRGLVHGVFFRASLKDVALSVGVAGWARNMVDGSVEAVLEGEEDSVKEVLAWARRGPSRARVDSVRAERRQPRNYRGFRIIG